MTQQQHGGTADAFIASLSTLDVKQWGSVFYRWRDIRSDTALIGAWDAAFKLNLTLASKSGRLAEFGTVAERAENEATRLMHDRFKDSLAPADDLEAAIGRIGKMTGAVAGSFVVADIATGDATTAVFEPYFGILAMPPLPDRVAPPLATPAERWAQDDRFAISSTDPLDRRRARISLATTALLVGLVAALVVGVLAFVVVCPGLALVAALATGALAGGAYARGRLSGSTWR